jgi:hypothetical protein
MSVRLRPAGLVKATTMVCFQSTAFSAGSQPVDGPLTARPTRNRDLPAASFFRSKT